MPWGWASAWLPANAVNAKASGTKNLHIEFSSHRNETKESDAFRQTINGKGCGVGSERAVSGGAYPFRAFDAGGPAAFEACDGDREKDMARGQLELKRRRRSELTGHPMAVVAVAVV